MLPILNNFMKKKIEVHKCLNVADLKKNWKTQEFTVIFVQKYFYNLKINHFKNSRKVNSFYGPILRLFLIFDEN